MRKLLSIAVLLLAGCLLAAGASAHEYKIGNLEIGHPYSRAMVPGAKVGSGYLKITNNGSEDDRLIGLASDRAKTLELHEMKIDANNVMTMREVTGGIVIPAGQTVELKPGGYHLMFQNVAQPFKDGEMIPATLTFEKAGSVAVEFMVGKPGGAMGDMDHGSDGGSMQKMDMPADPQQAIPDLMKVKFETPQKPLSVGPVTVQGDWAVAGWTQDGRGGRVLLMKMADDWMVDAISGDSLTDAAALEKLGLGSGDAAALAARVAQAERQVDAKTLALFSSFEGTVGASGTDGSAGGHAGHAQ